MIVVWSAFLSSVSKAECDNPNPTSRPGTRAAKSEPICICRQRSEIIPFKEAIASNKKRDLKTGQDEQKATHLMEPVLLDNAIDVQTYIPEKVGNSCLVDVRRVRTS
jgi:hypothetical protein